MMVIHVQEGFDNVIRVASVRLNLMITPFSISTVVSLFCEKSIQILQATEVLVENIRLSFLHKYMLSYYY